MGIEDFSTLLEKNAPASYYKVPLSSWTGKRIAIDMDNLMYIMMIVSTKQIVSQTNLAEKEPDPLLIHRLTLDKVLERLSIFLYYDIGVICCFDSQPHPLKDRIRQKRRTTFDKKKTEYEAARDSLYGTDPLFRNAQLTGRFAKAIQNNVKPSWEFMSHTRNLLESLGFPVFRAGDLLGPITGDAEALAASLCINGYCIAGATTDSDFHAYGANLAITELTTERSVREGVNITTHYATVRSLEAILLQMQVSFETFRDICILLGTDYNLRIPQVGPVKIMTLIRKHGSILGIASEKDIGPLNYLEVLPIFQSTIVKLTPSQIDFDAEKFRSNARAVLEIEDLSKYVKIINELPALTGLPIVDITQSVASQDVPKEIEL